LLDGCHGFKIAAILTLFFTVCIGLIRALPYDNSELHAFLTPPDGCPMPCFISIRPGVTPLDEAVRILDEHEWVTNVTLAYNESTGAVSDIHWKWDGRQPDAIAQEARIDIKDGIVYWISIPTTLSLGDTWAIWGVPDEYVTTPIGGAFDAPPGLVYVDIYKDEGFWVTRGITIHCPYLPAMWHSQVSILFSQDEDIAFSYDEHRSSSEVAFGRSVIDLRDTFCSTG
jgi:hypothetical protein